MANYAIGDVQGCFFELKGLLDEINFDPTQDKLWFVGDLINRGPDSEINFDPTQDKLWFVGDLINRGPDSLRTIEFIYKIKDSCNVVLGNHDIHFLAVAENLRKPFKEDTLKQLLESENLNLYKEWLRNQSLLYYENIQCEDGNKIYLMTHAGIPPHWSWQVAMEAAQEIKEALSDDKLYRII